MSWTPPPKILGRLTDGELCVVDVLTGTTHTPWSYSPAADFVYLQLGSDGVSLFMTEDRILKVIRPNTAPYHAETIGAYSDYENLCVADGFVYVARPDGYIYRMAEDGSGEVLLGRVFSADHKSQMCNGIQVRGDVLYATWSNTDKGYRVAISSWTVSATPNSTSNWLRASAADFDTGVLWMSSLFSAPQLVAGFSPDSFRGTPTPQSDLWYLTFIGDKLYGMTSGSGHVFQMDARARNLVQIDLGDFGLRAHPIADASIYQDAYPSPSIYPHPGTFQGVQIVTIQGPGVIRYTLDGSEPTTSSPIYTAPFRLSSPTTVKAKAFGLPLESTTATAILDIQGASLQRIPNYQDHVLPYLLEQYKGDNA